MPGIGLEGMTGRATVKAVGVAAALVIVAIGLSRLGPVGGTVAGPAGVSAPTSQLASAASAQRSLTIHGTVTTGRMMVEQAALSLTVSRVGATASRIATLTAHEGGYIESSNFSGGTTPSGTETLRVPASHLPALLTALKGLGHVQQSSLSGQDVTRQYSSLTFQLSALKAEDLAYQRLFSKATSMHSMIQIQQALSQVQSQMTQLGTEQLNLAHQVRMATVNVSLAQTAPPPPGFQAGDILAGSLHAMGQAGLFVAQMILVLLPWLALLLILATPVWYWRIRRRPV